ncbi:MAG: DUF418 domain-containing protein [Chromatiales bacterium]|nr:DUF418 domain-containing protein [Chromatiales bacterium]
MNTGPVPQQERVQALDVARGIAVLGVLLMNIWAFAGPQAFFDYPLAIADRAGAPVATWVVIHTLFEGSQRTLLSLIFGAGALLFMTRQEKDDSSGAARGNWYRRTFVLIAFGLVNAYIFMWPADILFVYGLAGLCLFPLRKLRTPVLLAIVLGALTVPAVLRGLEIGHLRELEAASIQQPGSAAAAEWAKELGKARPSPADDDMATDIRTMQTGGFTDIFIRQAKVSIILQTIVAVKWWFLDALAMMILGMVLCRSGILTRPAPRSRYAAMSVAGFAIGLPLAIWQTSTLLASDFHPVTVEITKLTYDVRRLAMALGYLGLILWFCHSAGGVAIRRALAAAGRMALTNYLAQSILCALIFYGFGLGLYGKVTGYQLYFVVLGIWTLELAWSGWWLQRYQIGPFEWVWRSLTYRRRLGAKQELLHPVPEQGGTL